MRKQAFAVNKDKLSAEIRQRDFLNMKHKCQPLYHDVGLNIFMEKFKFNSLKMENTDSSEMLTPIF